MKSLKIAMIGVSAALYATIGYLTYFGIFCPGVGVVRFWPSVVIPAIFGVLFGPLVGGISAAIGIFISDMLVHGNVLLSILVGVPSNFVCFFLIGYISRKNLDWEKTYLGIGVGVGVIGLIVYLMATFPSSVPHTLALMFGGVCAGSFLGVVVFGHLWPEWRSYGAAAVIGNFTGSTIIGLGLWASSQFFLLPSGDFHAPLYLSLVWLVWTFATEIPFLLAIVPPVLKAYYKAFPDFKPRYSEESNL